MNCNVERTSGKIEKNWKIEGRGTTRVHVSKGHMAKAIKFEDFTKYNPDIDPEELPRAPHLINPEHVIWATEALSSGKEPTDISRPEGDYAFLKEVQPDGTAIGSWITGLGFYDVKFKAGTWRKLTKEEADYIGDHTTVLR